MLSEIVRKLMAKNAEERYQSAAGIKHDLLRCQQEWHSTGKQVWVELGQRDLSDRFLIPERLYGRELEVQALLEAFGRVANGAAELMLVAGFSGIGKTAVVNEVHKPIVRWRGYFIKGKYDQFNRSTPFSAFVQAFRDLMGQLLSESDTQLAAWKTQILSAVGENGQVLIEVIPELEQVIGKQLPAPELSGSAAQNRFNLLFQKFIGVFATREHPLVVFLDDLQWADAGSLNLMQVLMGQQEVGYLLLIGAYRDNEVFPAHPLMRTLQEIEKASVPLSSLTLAALSQTDINHLIADTLSCSVAQAVPLSKLVYQKTGGNPFFTTQFLKALYEEGYITFDLHARHWQCDIAAVKTEATTNDVVQFMALQLQKLPDVTQALLKLAACIGAQFDLNTLAIVSQKTAAAVAIDLWKALQEELILPISEVYKFYQPGEQDTQAPSSEQFNCSYRFLHDRVQQAAYCLIPDDQKQATHFKIGQLLLRQRSSQAKEEHMFEIVNQLNHGIDCITEKNQQNELAQFNLIACREARAATAYQAATEYAMSGIRILAKDCWQTQYQLALALHNLGAEVAYLAGNFGTMTELIQTVLHCVQNPLDTIRVHEVQIQAYGSQNRAREAVQLGKEVLALLGMAFPENVTDSDVQTAIDQIMSLLTDRSIEDLIDLPHMTDEIALAAMRILSNITTLAYQAAPDLYPLVPLKQVSLSIQYGNSSQSAFGYVGYGIILCGLVEDIESGYRFGQLAMNLLDQFDTQEVTSKVMNGFNCLVRHWKEHTQETVQSLWDGYTIGLETGDLEFAGINIRYYNTHSYFLGQELPTLAKEMRTYTHALQRIKQERLAHHNEIQRQRTLNLLGEVEDVLCLKGEAYDEETMLSSSIENNDLFALLEFYFTKLQLSYLFGRYDLAQEYAVQTEQCASGGLSMVISRQSNFYTSLTYLAGFLAADQDTQAQILNQVIANQEKMRRWANHCPINVLHQYHLVEAEKYRVLGNKAEAIELYDRAISGAKENGYTQEEALANELAAKFYLEWGKEQIAQKYITSAYYGYARWGAKAKIADLGKRYPQLLAPILQSAFTTLSVNETIFATAPVTATTSSSSISDALDLAAVLKASQTLSGEIELDNLLSVLLHTVIQTAEADKGVPMLTEAEELKVRAVTEITAATPLTAHVYPIAQSIHHTLEVPMTLVNSVRRSLQPAVIIDASVHPQFATDPYIQARQTRSILCSPILHQGKLLGVVYLENTLTIGAFTAERVEILNLLCAQAAISLENARLYKQSQQYAQELERSLNELNVAQSRFYNLVDNVPGVVYQFRIAADGTMTLPYISSDCYEMYEVTAEQAIANVQLLLEQIHPDDRLHHQQSIIRSMETLTPWKWEGRIVTFSGITKWIQGEARINRQVDGTLIWDGLLLDITNCKRDEQILQQKTQALENALNDLQSAQLQIVQSEKMSALGNLVAGVAHEINNPVSFIVGNLQPALDYVNDTFGLLELYQQEYPKPTAVIEEEIESIDLEYIREDLPKLLNSMKLGVDRIRSISTSLRTFSRADKDYKVPFDIHQGIDSTVLILKHRLKANDDRPAIEVETEYGNIPKVECFPGQLNQVFMNILANAIDALEETNRGRSYAQVKANPNQIRIRTALSEEQQQVVIGISDNGTGMTAEVKQQIFEHLFTTKAVG